ncbi:MAG: DUF5677 domain-containing protein [Candidatus Zixiibacteriota bacterium]
MNIELDDKRWEEYVLNKHKEYFDLASSFLVCANNLQAECVRKRITREELGAKGYVLSFLFAKSYKTTKAALLLCKSGYTEDALILARVNFEAALWALYIIKDKENAEEKAQAFIKYDAIDRKERLQKILNHYENNDEFKEKLREELGQVQKELPVTEDECKRVCKLAKKKVRELASESAIDSRLSQLLYGSFYWESSNYTHNSIRSSNSYVSDTEGHIHFLLVPAEKGLRNVLVHLCLFLWYVMDRFNFLFELGLEKTLTDKFAELSDFCKKTDPRN